MFSRPDGGTAVAEPQTHRACTPVLPGDPCDYKDCPAKVQVAIDDTAAGPLGFCAHHGREVFDQMILHGRHPVQPRHIGDLKPWA
jgi:hypothetical protein